MKPPAASPGRAEKQLPAPPGLARLLLSKSRRGGGRSRRAPATSPMFVSRGRGGAGRATAADGEPSSPKVTCIGQVRMRKGKKGKKGKKAAAASKVAAPEKGRGYCRCLKKAFLCGGLFDFDRRRRPKAPSPEVVERSRRSPWVFSSRDVAVAAAPKQPDPRGKHAEEDEEMEASAGVFGSLGEKEAEELGINGGGDDKEDEVEEEEAELVSSATTTPPKNALLLMRCRSAPQNRSSPLTSRFPVSAPSPTMDAAAAEIAAPSRAFPSPRKSQKEAAAAAAAEAQHEERQEEMAPAQEQEEVSEEEEEDEDDDYDEEDMRCSSARPLVLPRCKSEPATTAAAKMAGSAAAEATTAGCFWANGGSSGRRRHAPPAAAPPVALAGH